MSNAKPSADDLRSQFWQLPPEALVPRETVAAVAFCGVPNIERLAIYGGGPAYRRVGRRALYAKADVLAWLTAANRVDSTAQLPEPQRRAKVGG